MKKLNISINLLQLQGAVRATIKNEDCVVIRLAKSRAKAHQNGKVYLNLEAISNKNGEDQYGNTHFVCEPQSKDERMSGADKLPIIGNGKEWTNDGQEKRDSYPPRTTRNIPRAQPHAESEDDQDSIPF